MFERELGLFALHCVTVAAFEGLEYGRMVTVSTGQAWLGHSSVHAESISILERQRWRCSISSKGTNAWSRRDRNWLNTSICDALASPCAFLLVCMEPMDMQA